MTHDQQVVLGGLIFTATLLIFAMMFVTRPKK